MAKENFILLRGVIKKKPKFIGNAEENTIKEAIFKMTVIRRDIFGRGNSFEPKMDYPIVSTSSPEIIRQIIDLNLTEGDVIEVKGTYKTKGIEIKCECPNCHKINSFSYQLNCVSPQFVQRMAHFDTSAEGLSYLKNHAEISNICKVIGTVCVSGENFRNGESENGDSFLKYKIAVNRKIKEFDSVDKEDHVDYPYVCSFNDVAAGDRKMLKLGTMIYIDGFVHTSAPSIGVLCGECSTEFSTRVQNMNITPYSVEYLRDYIDNGFEQSPEQTRE